MEERVKNVILSLEIESEDDVRMIGIWGMGGAGKTTLARAVFDHISIWFEGKSFVENVRECSKGMGLKELQRQILSAVLNDRSIDVAGVSDGKNMMKRMMLGTKVLVVLDDVDDIDQLEVLAGNANWFKPGSRIIITTRDKQVLIAQGVNVDNIYNISLLSREEAICLFSRHAFSREVPNQGYEELSQQVVYCADGLPLTIKVLGSFLCGKTEWLDTLERLKTIPLEKTLKKLEISYDGLEKDHKEIFLDVACILKGKPKDNAIRMLESCGFHAQIGLEVLEQKSLINILYNGYLGMHDHIEEMGKNIVRRLHPEEPNRHSRLWVKEEIEKILVNDLGTKATRSMNLRYLEIHPAIVMKSLRKMKKIRLLLVKNIVFSKNWEIDEGDVQYLPDTLRSLYWTGYPLCCLPTTFQANNLVNLEMPLSNISQLWKGGERKDLEKIRFVDLSSSNLRTFDLGMTRNLETLDLNSCVDLVELQIPFALPMLNYLDLSYSKVINLNLGMTPNIRNLRLAGCKDLVELQMPVALPMLKDLDLHDSKVSNLNLGMTPNIENLRLARCKELVELQMPIALLMLKELDLSDSKVSNINLEMAPNIENLCHATFKEMVEFQIPVALPMLNYLDLSYSKVINLNLGMTPNIENLRLARCKELVELQMPVALLMLKELDLSYSKVSNLNLGMAPNIENLRLARCKELVELQMPVALLMLNYLDLSDSKVSNLNLGMTPNIENLRLARCKELVELQMPVALLMLTQLDLSYSKMSNLNLVISPNIESFCLVGCHDLVELQVHVTLPMTSIILRCVILSLDSLHILKLIDCYYLQEIHVHVGSLKKLTCLKLSGCSSKHAFRREVPIKVLGSFLCGRTEPLWLDTLERLKAIPSEETLKKLEISYDDLEKDQKEIFLDVACILKGKLKYKAIIMLESCGFHAQIGLEVLEQKSLIYISDYGNLRMHDHIEEMGKNIVRRLHPDEPNRHSRLWVKEEIEEILLNDLVLEKIRFVDLSFSKLRTFNLGTTQNLETLDLRNCNDMAELQMPSKLPKLKDLILSHSMVNLDLEGCKDLVELQLPNALSMLNTLNLSDSKVSNLNLEMTPNIENLYLIACKKLILQIPVALLMLKTLNLSNSKASNINLEMTPNIENLCLASCKDFTELQVLVALPMLNHLDLSHSNVTILKLGMTPNIKNMYLQSCKYLVELQMPVAFTMLQTLWLDYSKVSKLNLGMTPNIEKLSLKGCKDLLELQMPIELSMLNYLHLSDSKVSNLNLGMTPNIKFLCIERCKDLIELQMPIVLSMLYFLELNDSKVSNLNLELTPDLTTLNLIDCYYLQEIHAPVGCLKKLTRLNLSGCLRFEYIRVNTQYFSPRVDSLAKLELIAESLGRCPLHPNNNLPKLKFQCKYGEVLPSSSGNLEKLLSFGLCACTNLDSFSASICGLKHLIALTLDGNITEAPKDLWKLASLEVLTLSMKEIKQLPDNICMLKHLKSLDLKSC
ncbi:hypothetical protein R6Q59_016567 [Mikania micrantha]